MSESRELLCQVCDRDYQVWSAPNPIWNAAIRQTGTDEWAFLCPTCFTNIAAERGAHTGWMVTDGSTGYEVAAQLAWALGEICRLADDAHEFYRLGEKVARSVYDPTDFALPLGVDPPALSPAGPTT